MKYRKKPVVIEAVQWEPDRKPSDYPRWLWELLIPNPHLFDEATGALTIPTLEGEHRCDPGSWIIRGVKGELYPCRADIFAATYEPATTEQETPHVR